MERTERARFGGADDLTAYCEHCGKPLPETATVARRFCDATCARRARDVIAKRKRLESKAGRLCAWCGAPMAPQMKAFAKFCCDACQVAARVDYDSRKLRKAKAARRCQHCGGPMPVDRKHAKFCCERCQIAAGRERAKVKRGPVQDRARKPKPCEHCGAMFKGRPGQRFCGKSCTTAARWAAGTMRHPKGG